MARLTIVIDVENVDPLRQDPHEVAEDALDYHAMRIDFSTPIEFVSAEWTEPT
jgi:hypothetical protein